MCRSDVIEGLAKAGQEAAALLSGLDRLRHRPRTLWIAPAPARFGLRHPERSRDRPDDAAATTREGRCQRLIDDLVDEAD